MKDEWGTWMRAAQEGNESSYARLLHEISTWLTRYYARRVHVSLVSDLVQETLMSIHAKRHTYDPSQLFGPWLAAVARHRWIDHLRKQSRAVEVELFDTIAGSDTADANDYARDLEVMMREIPEKQAHVIRLVKIQGHSIAEVSHVTGHSEASVKVMIHRGMKRMAELARDAG
jgi:RNA polymerase sigma factor (sigma-70 family)